MKTVRHQFCLRHRNCDPNDPFEFLRSDAPCFEVKDVLKAGSGLFVNRPFKKDEFIINYRGKIKAQNISTDNVYSIETGAPEFLVVDASDNLDCLARFINDVDPFHVQNCRPMKSYKSGTTSWTKAIFATKSIDTGEQLRYKCGAKFAPWRDIKFWRQAASSEAKRKLPCVQSQLMIEMKRKGRKKKPKVHQITQSENCKAQTEPEMKEVTLAVVKGSETKGKSSIDDKVEVRLTEFNKATNDTEQQPKIVSTQFHRDSLLNNQQPIALKRHHRIAEKLAGNYSVTLEQGPRSTGPSKKTVKRRPEQLPQQDFTPEAETEERQQETTLAAEIGERQQESTAAAEIGEAQQFTPAAETEERQQEMTPAAEIRQRQQESTAAAEIGEAQQFTPPAETEERQQEMTPAAEIRERQQESTAAAEIAEAQQFTPAAKTEERQQEMTPAAIRERQQESTAAAENGEAQHFTPAAEIGEAQQFTPAAEVGEAQQFTPAAENGAQQFTPAADTEERQQEMTPAAIRERQQESTAAAENGEAQHFTPAAEIGEAQQFTPAAEVGEAQQFTPAAENGEAQQFTPAAETEERQQEMTPAAEIGEAQQFTPAAENGEAQQGGEHNQIDGLPHEYSENLIDEISEVPLIGFVNDTSLTFIDLPVAATETTRERESQTLQMKVMMTLIQRLSSE